MAVKKAPSGNIVGVNRRARFDYFIDETLEAGIMLAGTEVKALRLGRLNLQDSYAGEMNGELVLINAHIGEYPAANQYNHEPKRPRRLLVKRRERARLFGLVQRERVTIVPLKVYFNDRGIAKVELGIARGKKKYDKRETEKKRDWNREKARLMREKG
ncbi:SsrA-binding protein SmpB [Fodinicurvata sp. EGI_FJ10296]|uniref:SsrA-binding protein SmpB n=1 Tax=Fodinicurvata sp. EGI_FJ10296 TaxID=3231908 RepID=UPI0034543A16